MNGKGASSFDGVFSAPLGQSFGLQLEGSTGRLIGNNYSGLGGHLFWREPSRGLVGLVGSFQKLGGTSGNRNGAEGEAYLERFTVVVRGGQQSGDIQHGGYIGLGGRYYISDNVAFNLGYDRSPGSINTNGIGMEWQPTNWGIPGLSLFARGSGSTGGNHALAVGVRFYVGGNKTLIQRHRNDDPESVVMPLGDVIPTPNIRVPVPAVAACVPPKKVFLGVCQLET